MYRVPAAGYPDPRHSLGLFLSRSSDSDVYGVPQPTVSTLEDYVWAAG